MIVIYFYGSMIYLNFWDNYEMHWLMVSIKILSSKENLQMVDEIFLSLDNIEEFVRCFRICISDRLFIV